LHFDFFIKKKKKGEKYREKRWWEMAGRMQKNISLKILIMRAYGAASDQSICIYVFASKAMRQLLKIAPPT
jgi:hypothetical protein